MDLKNNSDDKNTTDSGNQGLLNFTFDDIVDRDILDLMGEKGMSNEEKSKLYTKMVETIQFRVMGRIDDKLSDEEAAQAKKILEENDKEKFIKFLAAKGINLEKIYAEEALIYKVQMVDMVSDKGDNDAKN